MRNSRTSLANSRAHSLDVDALPSGEGLSVDEALDTGAVQTNTQAGNGAVLVTETPLSPETSTETVHEIYLNPTLNSGSPNIAALDVATIDISALDVTLSSELRTHTGKPSAQRQAGSKASPTTSSTSTRTATASTATEGTSLELQRSPGVATTPAQSTRGHYFRGADPLSRALDFLARLLKRLEQKFLKKIEALKLPRISLGANKTQPQVKSNSPPETTTSYRKRSQNE